MGWSHFEERRQLLQKKVLDNNPESMKTTWTSKAEVQGPIARRSEEPGLPERGRMEGSVEAVCWGR